MAEIVGDKAVEAAAIAWVVENIRHGDPELVKLKAISGYAFLCGTRRCVDAAHAPNRT